ncbi:ADP-ribose-binding protein [Listeria ivanovii]|uniref:ADP-ribose-binding protein n=1 Tax=Listeria ivanovii TaxID=1638 RepID=UPI000DA7DB83|nr:ADP-ribose-binding protein [Listeria ivanovii]PZF90583.1 ADP-ribose-binding protein [Listeria ivanovii]PZF95969.1 ADP-ribose-binding protein [Listeria ivanovii]PZG06219.1 ADP-ribose-binding protein [Listeria ivanovii]PZG10998.1 ADP-ribose-binding protein [Listeria ivanovii]PZG28107.1 ADP-ribose-binding protein [Listeria ivanovii]
MKLTIVKGDITEQDVDVIVNAANSGLLGGAGVDGAIHQAAGPNLLKECQEIINRIGSCPAGEAVITAAGELKTHYIIHAVGPVWKGGEYQEANKLASCYWKSLDLAAGKDLTSIAFPNISTGVYGFPKKLAAEVVLYTVRKWIEEEYDSSIKEIRFVCYDDENLALYNKLIKSESV